MAITCCYRCTRRHENCHAACPDYALEAARHAEELAAKNAVKQREEEVIIYKKHVRGKL